MQPTILEHGTNRRRFPGILAGVGIFACSVAVRADPRDTRGIELFETRIRPVLVQHCYECHNSTDAAEGGLALDSRERTLKGGRGGPIVVPGKPVESRLMKILRHEAPDLEMPQGGEKLPASVLADFERWIALGAPDPRDTPPTADELSAATSWAETFARRKEHWSFQPIRRVPPPETRAPTADHPIDRFLQASLEAKGLSPGEPADTRTLIRRTFFTLTGLPPGATEADAWSAKFAAGSRPVVFAQLVDELLSRPQFGERWARHWMDWVRYAESHGSEGDPEIDNAWHYRDYLIRALNADVPVDQLIREHVAGDLVEVPRVNRHLGINESAIGPAQWRMVYHGYSPTDVLEEKVRFTDDQVDVFSKAFLGLTVSCARCHDHKFDAISQGDYYALFGIFASCKPARTVIDLPELQIAARERLAALKPQIRAVVAEAWLDDAAGFRRRLMHTPALEKGAGNRESLRGLFVRLRERVAEGSALTAAWNGELTQWRQNQSECPPTQLDGFTRHWSLAHADDFAQWFPKSSGWPLVPSAAGEFSIAADGDDVLTGIYPAGVYSHTLTAKAAARLLSPDLRLGTDYTLWLRVVGDGGASARYVVQNYPRKGPIFPITTLPSHWTWQKLDLAYWKDEDIHIELATARDMPLPLSESERSWFGVRDVLLVPKASAAPAPVSEMYAAVFDAAGAAAPATLDELAGHYVSAMQSAASAWRDNVASNAQADFLGACVAEGLLTNSLIELCAVRPLVEEFRRIESGIAVPTRIPGLDETVARDQALFERGDHKRPAQVVPRRFLEAFDATPYASATSGRRELAESLLRDDNPLTRRVLVNRVWQHLFGRGIVATPDNLGRLGERPTHPELLDWLALRFADEGWSLKWLIRLMVSSDAWQRSSTPTPLSKQLDPNNDVLSHAHGRRLEAEGLRDSLLFVSGRLDGRMYGEPAPGESLRRSIYVRVHRNSLDPFLRVFDFPEPFSAVGRRDATNVPAQWLTMLNDPFVARLAEAWGAAIAANTSLPGDAQRVGAMFATALGRPPTSEESADAIRWLAETPEHCARWPELARALFSLKEFMYVR